MTNNIPIKALPAKILNILNEIYNDVSYAGSIEYDFLPYDKWYNLIVNQNKMTDQLRKEFFPFMVK